jgi:RpiB/LacA/LacB family sugar-phosphate isomerase
VSSPSYVYYTHRTVRHLVDHLEDRAIFACGNGVTMALLANRIPGMRASVCHDLFNVSTVREMINANIISFGERVIGFELAWDLTQAYLSAVYRGNEQSRYAERLAQITQVEANLYQPGWLAGLDDYLRQNAPDKVKSG